MTLIKYKIKDPLGIHARPAGLLVKKTKEFKSDIKIEKDGKTADAKKLMAVMTLGIKFDDNVTIKVDGEDENIASAELKKFLNENL